MSYGTCPACRETYVWLPNHTCKPAFRVWCPYYGGTEDDAREVRATDAESAATEWAARFDAYGDYTIVGGSDATVHVRAPDGTETRWVVSGASVPHYSARMAKP